MIGLFPKIPLHDTVAPLERIFVWIDFIGIDVCHFESIILNMILDFRPALDRLLGIPEVE